MVAKFSKKAFDKGMMADYVLKDTWFTHAPLIKSISKKAYVIGMVKQMKQRYFYDGQQMKLYDLFKRVRPPLQKRMC